MPFTSKYQVTTSNSTSTVKYWFIFQSWRFASLVPTLSPHANEKSKERGEPGRIYDVRNIIGRENLITCGRTNELAHTLWTEYSYNSFMADRMGLDGTMLHYLAVRKAMVSVHKPVHSKITLTYSLTWQTDRCTSWRMAFKALLNAKAALS